MVVHVLSKRYLEVFVMCTNSIQHSVKCLSWSSLRSPGIATNNNNNNNDIVVDCASQNSPQTSSQPFTVRDSLS